MPLRFQKSTAGFQQVCALVRNGNTQSKIVISGQKIDNLLPKMMNVDDKFLYPETVQVLQGMLQHRLAGYLGESFGMMFSKGFQPRAHTGREYHGFHGCSSVLRCGCSLWCTMTFTCGNFSRRNFPILSAP